ncbi:5'-3' exonuclease H3TH domain-containing protein (plasmid) [Rossellomorea sp. AcN35-11]|nr:5'-3' exonuclease [Rossellomorea aquimaris]WJV32387.1 5'-3' exonuclease H3TH domain-containing protein [Rossellomorea sp. AcN35-11]
MIKQMTLEELFLNEGTNEEISGQKEESSRKVLLLLDGPNILSRAYYATSIFPEKMMKTEDGQYVNGVHGFLQMLNQYMTTFKPTHIAACFDENSATTFRKKMYPDYKEGRKETPPELKSQFPIIRDILPKIGIQTFAGEVYEADDFIASLKEKFLNEHPEGEVFIISKDQDLLQLVDDSTTVISKKNKSEIHYDPSRFSEDYYGFNPEQIIDLKAIQGDTSDNIKGIPGIGEKGAVKLLQKYNSVELLLENKDSLDSSFSRYRKNVLESGDEATFCKKLTTLVKNIEEVTELKTSNIKANIDISSLIEICKKYQFPKILNAIEFGKWDK